jgi:hypothetical protein
VGSFGLSRLLWEIFGFSYLEIEDARRNVNERFTLSDGGLVLQLCRHDGWTWIEPVHAPACGYGCVLLRLYTRREVSGEFKISFDLYH